MTITRYRKKPIPVEARQLTGESYRDLIRALTEEQFAGAGENTNGTVFLEIRTLEGVMHASEGDWIVWGNHGDVWPVRGVIFAETYEPADSPAVPSRADTLREAADAGEDVANRIHNSGDDHRAGGAYDVVDELRRMAAEEPQP